MTNLTNGGLDDIAPYLTPSGYFFLAVCGFAYFIVQHFVLHILIKICYPKYLRLTAHDMHEYRIQWNAFFHAVIASGFAIYVVWFTCPDGKTFFND